MRVFVALACPPELMPVIQRYQELLKDVPGVRLLDAESLHMTVIGPWEERDPEAVLRDFAAVDSGPIAITFDDTQVRPTKYGGLLWLGGSNTPELKRLWLQAWRAIQSHDPRGASLPHITVARFPGNAVLREIPELPPITVHFDRLCLYQVTEELVYRVIGEKSLA